MASGPQQPSSAPFVYKPSSSVIPGQATASSEKAVAASAVAVQREASAGNAEAASVFNPSPKVADDPGTAYGYRKSLLGHKDEVSVYTAQMDAKHALDHRTKAIVVSIVVLVVLVPLVMILPVGLFGPGKPAVTPALVIDYVRGGAAGLINWLSGEAAASSLSIRVWQIVAVPLVGAVLALNGCVFQATLNNALASPSTLGVMSGASLGTIVYTLLFAVPEEVEPVTVVFYDEMVAQIESMDFSAFLFALFGRAMFSLAGCVMVVVLVLFIARVAGQGSLSKVSLIIAGQVFTALIAGVVSVIYAFVNYYGTMEQEEAIASMVDGSFDFIVDPLTFLVMAVPLIIGVVIILMMRFKLNVLAFSDEEAKSMGMRTTATRYAAIIVCTVLTGVVVSFVGSVGFVGFLVPHLARKVVGPDLRYLIPASLVFGGIFLLVAYYLMQLTGIFGGSLGTLTSLVGAVAFLIIAIRERAKGNVDWV